MAALHTRMLPLDVRRFLADISLRVGLLPRSLQVISPFQVGVPDVCICNQGARRLFLHVKL